MFATAIPFLRVISARFLVKETLVRILWMLAFGLVGCCIFVAVFFIHLPLHRDELLLLNRAPVILILALWLWVSSPLLALLLCIRGKLPGTQRRKSLMETLPGGRKSIFYWLAILIAVPVGGFIGIFFGFSFALVIISSVQGKGDDNSTFFPLVLGFVVIGFLAGAALFPACVRYFTPKK